MSTNFFEQQDKARKRTGLLVACFIIGLLLMIAVLYAVTMIIFNMVGMDNEGPESYAPEFWSPGVLGLVACVTTLLVGGSSLFKIMELRSGGRVVADMLGARLVSPDTREHSERVALNVVEEMSIASGSPVPPLYILEDPAINAFAAGWSPNDAVVSLNRGTIDQLSRDELQGVVAHEFSHIFNGDMRINIRLIGVIHGLLVLGVTGWIMLRYIGPATLGSGRRSSSKDSGGAGVGMAIMLLGVTLMICGFIGTFFGRLVQAAVSRQREFLADASAVQYTRNPDGIGGALRKIKLMIRPDETELPKKAADISHMFFTKAIDSIFATHPPLPERIARVEGLDIDDVERQLKEQKHRQPPPLRGQPAAAQPSMPAMHVDPANVVQGAILAAVLQDSIAHVGEVTPQQLSEARRIIDSIPAPLQEAAHSMASARMVVLCLLRDEDEADQQLQENYLREALDPMSFQQWHGLVPLMADVPPGSRLPLLDLCIPSLSQMSEEQYGQFRDLMNRMIKIDGQIDRWEWVVDTVIDRHLEERYHKPGAERKANMKLDRAIDAGTMVMATLACTGAQAEEQAQAAFAAGLSHLGWQRTLPDPRSLSLGVLREALRQLRKVRFADRGRFLEACGMCVLHDGITTVEESETLRAVAESIDCPMPLIVSQG